MSIAMLASQGHRRPQDHSLITKAIPHWWSKQLWHGVGAWTMSLTFPDPFTTEECEALPLLD